MARQLKGSVFALIVMLAVGAASASLAQAESFEASEYPVTITGTQLNEPSFTAGGLAAKCAESSFMSNPDPEAGAEAIMVDASFAGECETEGLPTTVQMNGCSLELYAAATGAKAPVDLSCPTGNSPLIQVYLNAPHTIKACAIKITPTLDTKETGVPDAGVGSEGRTYGPLEHVVYKEDPEAEGRMILQATVTGLRYHTEGSLCPEPGKSGENGQFVGETTLEGSRGGKAVPLWFEKP